MNKHIRLKYILPLLLALVILAALPIRVRAAQTPASGTCGENLTWSLSEDGTLTISGTGEMDDSLPWEDYYDVIEAVVIESGVTSVSAQAFWDYPAMTSVSLPDTLTSIGSSAFRDSAALTAVTIPANVTKIGSRAFGGCSGLTQVIFQGSAPDISSSAFRDVTADVLYPANDSSWIEDVRGNYGGSLTWYQGCFEHSFDNYVYNGDATCTIYGTETGYCTVCGKMDMRIVEGSKLPHPVSDYTPNGDATCTADGTKSGICEVCGATATVPDEGSRLPHAFTDYASDSNATCTDGTETALCDYGCGAKNTRTEEGSANSDLHVYVEVLMKTPSCTVSGYRAEVCKNCGHVGSGQAISPTGHDPQTLYAADATCTTQGYTGDRVCKTCGCLIAAGEVIDYSGHSWDENRANWDVRIPATHSHTGIAAAPCLRPGCTATQDREIPVLETANPFTDIGPDSFAYDAVMWAVREDITSGRTKTQFMPKEQCMRSEVVTFLHRSVSDRENTDEMPFTDVPADLFCYNAVNWAVKNGITNGVSATQFAPNRFCTRAEVVTLLWRACGKPTVSGSNSFRDVSSGTYYYDAVLWAAQSGITAGTSATQFSPDVICTREQIVTFLYRCFASGGGDTSPTEGQTGALNRAQELLELLPHSYLGLIETLESEGCSYADAVYAADNCGADWYEQALIHGNQYLNAEIGLSRQWLVIQLEYEQYTEGQIAYALANVTVDWNEQAVIRGRSYLNSGEFTRGELIAQLEYEYFTTEQATYAADALGL